MFHSIITQEGILLGVPVVVATSVLMIIFAPKEIAFAKGAILLGLILMFIYLVVGMIFLLAGDKTILIQRTVYPSFSVGLFIYAIYIYIRNPSG